MTPINNSMTGLAYQLNASRAGGADNAEVRRAPAQALAEGKASLANGQFTPQMMADIDNGVYTAQELFGPNTMHGIQFQVAGFGEHYHFIYVPEQGPAQILVGGPHPSGQLVVEIGDLSNSTYKPRPGAAEQNIWPVEFNESMDAASAWEVMTTKGQQIHESGLYYNLVSQNSNSVAQTVGNTVGFTIVDNDTSIIGGNATGLTNNLEGEMNGTETPAPNAMVPYSLNTDGYDVNFPLFGITVSSGTPDLSDPATESPYSALVEESNNFTLGIDSPTPTKPVTQRPINEIIDWATPTKPITQRPITEIIDSPIDWPTPTKPIIEKPVKEIIDSPIDWATPIKPITQ